MLDSIVFLDKLIIALLLMSHKILKNLCVYPTVSSPPVIHYTEPLKSNHRQLFMAEFNIILPWTSNIPKYFLNLDLMTADL